MEDQDALFDKVMESVGDNGYFQKRYNYFYNFLFIFFALMAFTNMVLAMSIPEHWCHVPGRNGTNYTLAEWKDITLPRANDSKGLESASSCQMYNITQLNMTSVIKYNTSENGTISCQFGYEYDTTWYDLTIPSQEDWVCDQDLLVANSFVYATFGEIAGTFVCGQLGDKIGRRPVFYIGLVIAIAGRLLTAFTASWYPVYVFSIIVTAFTSHAVTFCPLIIAMEISRSDNRAHIAMMQSFGYTFGMCVVPLVMWWLRNWSIFVVVTTLPLVFFLFTDRFMVESPRWLFGCGKKVECAAMLKKIAKANGTTLNEDALALLDKDTGPSENVFGIMSLFSSFRIAKNTVLIILCWIVGWVGYYILTLNVTNLAGNPYLNFLYQSAVELPAYILGRLASDKIGRRWASIGAFFLGFLACIPLTFIIGNHEFNLAATLISAFIKFCITITYYVVDLQAMETYPTCLRQTGISLGAMTANLFGVSGPYIVYLGTIYNARIPYIILGFGMFLGAVAAFFLPETLYQKLPESLAEARVFGKNQSFWAIPKKTKKIEE